MPIIEVKGRRIHYQELNKGAAESVLLVHGMLGNLAVYYFRIAPLLAEQYHVVLYDLKGHGLSERVTEGYDLHSMSDDLFALMDGLHLRKVHLAGYSFGALIALKAAVRAPERVGKLVLIEGPDPRDEEPLRIMMEYSREAFNDWVIASGLAMGRRQLEKHHQLYEFIFQQTTMQEDVQKEKEFFLSDAVGGVLNETLLIYGNASDCLPAGQLLARRLRRVGLLQVDGDHQLPVQNPETIAFALVSFFQEKKKPMKFVFVVPPLAGHVNPTLGVGAELLRRGHSVAWISLDPALEGMLPVGGRLLLVHEEGHKDSISRKNVYGVESIRYLYDEVLIPLNRHMRASIEDWVDWFCPDVIVNDHQLFAGAFVAHERGIPYATSVTAPAAVKMQEDLPGVHEWEVQKVVSLQRELGIMTEKCLACSDTLAFLYTTREFFGEMALPVGHRFVGPVIRRPASVQHFDWDRFNGMEGRPRILVSIGTTFDHSHSQQVDFLRKVVAAFSGADLGVVLISDENLLESWPENFLVQRRVPQLELLPKLDMVVCHGGHNTVCETLLSGLPMVVLPIAYDQSHVASRVVATESGIRLNFKRFKPDDLRESVWTVLTDGRYREAARRIGESFGAAGGAELAADLLEAMKIREEAGVIQ